MTTKRTRAQSAFQLLRVLSWSSEGAPQAVAEAIGLVRGKVLGCIFELPKGDGGLLDPNKVNVDYSVNGGAASGLYKRKSSANDCKNDGCWDYTNDGKVELLGKACEDVKATPNAKVSITVGCDTQVK
ncbi:hypothetical protein BH09MYX1_BH09MYX1_46100 [soil metagenome]